MTDPELEKYVQKKAKEIEKAADGIKQKAQDLEKAAEKLQPRDIDDHNRKGDTMNG